MGRKRKNFFENVTFDRIGEPVNLEKCPECAEHSDCFACIGGKCTALSESGGQGCVFYKPEHQALQEVRRAYQVLKENKRYDLIAKYLKALTALGATAQEFDAGEGIMADLNEYAAEDLAAQLEAMAEGGKKV
ncbi:hypothetical protein [Sporofaciens sp. SGI.106]|uniref:hypothetical protein n=1 Tax=Sporofaciens sp. SGI.106 TaxID=3420568 RepID=UPI003CFF0460